MKIYHNKEMRIILLGTTSIAAAALLSAAALASTAENVPLVSQFDFGKPVPTQSVVSSAPARRGEMPTYSNTAVIADDTFRETQQPLVADNTPLSLADAEMQPRLNESRNISVDTSHGAMAEVLTQLQQLQEAVAQLRGQVEVQAHAISLLEKHYPADQFALNDKSHIRYALEEANKSTTNPAAIRTQSTQQAEVKPTPVEESLVFNAAFTELKAKQYNQAIGDMEKFTKDFPNSRYLPEAYYWLGEMYLITGDEKNATNAFSVTVTHYPHAPKTADALLKLALLAYGQNNWDGAKKYFREVVQDFPNTSAANFANRRLQQMIVSGR